MKEKLNTYTSKDDKRIIVKPGDSIINPIHINKDTNITQSNQVYLYEKNDYKKALLIPPIIINSNQYLEIYNIKDIDSLLYLIDNLNSLDYTELTVNRLINSWIRINYNDLKEHNNILEIIYLKYIKYYNFDKRITFPDNYTNKLHDFIDYWIQKNNPNSFNLDLFTDFINHIHRMQKKYN